MVRSPLEPSPSRKHQSTFSASPNADVFFGQAAPWASDRSPSSPTVTPSTLQPPNKSIRSVQVHKLFMRQCEESQSTGNIEIT